MSYAKIISGNPEKSIYRYKDSIPHSLTPLSVTIGICMLQGIREWDKLSVA